MGRDDRPEQLPVVVEPGRRDRSRPEPLRPHDLEDLLVHRFVLVEPAADGGDELFGTADRLGGLAPVVECVDQPRLDGFVVLLGHVEVRALHRRGVHVDEARIDLVDGGWPVAIVEAGHLARIRGRERCHAAPPPYGIET